MTWDITQLQHGPLPLWAQIADRLREAIGAGTFSPGDKLPGETELVRRFDISRTTARAALDKLENEGRITRRAGKGSIVLPPRLERPLNLLSSFAEDMRARGMRASYTTRSIRALPAPKDVAAALRLVPDTPVITIDRLFLADGTPIAVATTRLAPLLFRDVRPPTVPELDGGSLYAWIECHAGIRLAAGSETIEAVAASASVARRLCMPVGAPLLVSRRLSRTAGGTPVEHVVMRYRADRYRLHVEMTRP